jgi:hypothetical protein
MPRYQSLGKRDAVEADIVDALKKVGCDVERGTDCDLFVKPTMVMGGTLFSNPRPMLMEIKIPGQESNLTKLQVRIKAIFGSQYVVVSSIDAALKAVGVTV